jgi:hypothetical protein
MDAALPAKTILNLRGAGIDLKWAGGNGRRHSKKSAKIASSLAAAAVLDLMTDLF